MASVRNVLFCLVACFAIVEAGKVDKETQADLKTFIDVGQLSFMDVIRCGALFLVTFVVLLSDKRGETRNWQSYDASCFAIKGLTLFFFPEEVLRFLVRNKTDHVHTFGLQVFGASLLGEAVVTYLQTRNRFPEPRLPFSWLLSRVFGSISAIIVVVHVQLKHYVFNDQAVCMVTMSLAMAAIGGLYKLFTFHGVYVRRGLGISRVTQTFMILQLIMRVPFAVSQLGMTEHVYETYIVLGTEADQVHFFFARIQGALLCMTLIQIVYSFQFQNDDDAKTIFAGRLVAMILVLPLLILYQWKQPVYTESGIRGVLPLYITGLLVMLAGYHSLDISLGWCSLFRKEAKND